MSNDDLDKSEEHVMKKIKAIKRNWFDRLIKQSVMGKKAKLIRDKLNDKIINDIWRLFDIEKEKEDRKKKQNQNITKDNIIRDIRLLFEQEKKEDIMSLIEYATFGIIIISTMKSMVINIEAYHFTNILIKLYHT